MVSRRARELTAFSGSLPAGFPFRDLLLRDFSVGPMRQGLKLVLKGVEVIPFGRSRDREAGFGGGFLRWIGRIWARGGCFGRLSRVLRFEANLRLLSFFLGL